MRNLFATACLAVTIIACGSNSGATFDDYRDVANLTNCSVSVQGWYYIGGIFSYDGANPAGPQREQAVKQAILDINAQSIGIHGRKLGLVACNTSSSTMAADRITELLQADPPLSAVIGGSGSADVIAESNVAIANGIVLMAGSATSPAITTIDDDGWLNRVAPSDAYQGVVSAKVAQTAGYTKVFVIHTNDAYGTGFHKAFHDAFIADGGQASDIAYTMNFVGTPTPGDVVEAARAYGPGAATLLISYTTEGRDIINYANSNAFTPQGYMFGDALRQQPFIDAVTDKASIQGALGTVPSTPAGGTYDGFVARYTGTWGSAPTTYGANFYDAAMLLALAMQLSPDPQDRVGVRDALLGRTHSGDHFTGDQWPITKPQIGKGPLDYDGASGPVDLDANGDVSANIDTWTVSTDNLLVKTGCYTPALTACQ